jgi:hypothetical protein
MAGSFCGGGGHAMAGYRSFTAYVRSRFFNE